MCTWGGGHLLGQSQSNILLSVIAMTRVSSSSVPQVPFPTRWPKGDKLSAEILSLRLCRTLTYHLQSYRFSPSTNKRGSGVGNFVYAERCIRENNAELQDPESFIVMRTEHSALFSRGIYPSLFLMQLSVATPLKREFCTKAISVFLKREKGVETPGENIPIIYCNFIWLSGV